MEQIVEKSARVRFGIVIIVLERLEKARNRFVSDFVKKKGVSYLIRFQMCF